MTRLRTALAEPEAPAVWTPPAGALRQVLVHLSPFARGCDGMEMSDPARWRWMAWSTPAAVMRRLLARLDRRADQVSLRAVEGLGGVEIHDGPPPHEGCGRLLAIVFDVPAADLRRAWAGLLPSAEIERHHIEGATVLTLRPGLKQQGTASRAVAHQQGAA